MEDVTLLVIAKEPVAGRVKTRLSPPYSPAQAAGLAAAALRDTLDVVGRTPARRRVLVFDGDPAGWTMPGWEVVVQRGDGLDQRLAAAFADTAPGPALLVGMDTPQLTAEMLLEGIGLLKRPGTDAVIGPTFDGGYWSVGLRSASPEVFLGVPMSQPGTLAAQCDRMRELGLRVATQSRLRDVDTAADAYAAAGQAPTTRFAAAVRSVSPVPGGLAASIAA